MKRTKKEIFDDHVSGTLETLLNNNGKAFDVGKLYRRRNVAKRVLNSVTSSLGLMGIKYKNPKGSLLLVVPTLAEIQEEERVLKEMMALAGPYLTGTAYANKMLAMGGRQSGKRSGLHFGMDLGSKDTNVVVQIRGNQIQQIIVDDYSRLEDRICEFLSKEKPL